MFDLITENIERPLRRRSPAARVISVVGHAVILSVLVVLPVLFAADVVPPVPPVMMAFVTAPPAPPPPPPPPAPAPPAATRAAERPVQKGHEFAAPIEAPREIREEPAVPAAQALAGVEGGVEGGVPGGIAGGIVGGIVSAPPPPPPPPPAPQSRAPVRIGGKISAPQLLRRVEPEYPQIAAVAHVGGLVIIEAVVDAEGCVESIKVLRSPHRLLEKAAADALRQWQYSPLILNGTPVSFVLTVTFSFSVGA